MNAKYKKLAAELRKQILDRQAAGLHKLPSEKEIGEQFQVSRQTVREALRLLTEERLIEKRKGSGSYITGLAPSTSENRIAILLRSPDEYISPTFLSDLSSPLKTMGYQPEVHTTGGSFETERQILLSLLSTPSTDAVFSSSSLRGLIVEPCHSTLDNPNLDLYEQLRSKGISILFLEKFHNAPAGTAFLQYNDYASGYEATRFLLSKNHSRIAGLFQADKTSGVERCHGFFSAMRDFGKSIPDANTLLFTQSHLSALETRRDTSFLTLFIRRHLKDCTAVICQNDEVAYWLAKELSIAGFQIPTDISLIGFDNSYLSNLGPTRITSFALPPHEPGATAASTLLKLMQGASSRSPKLSFSLSVKSSSGTPSVSGPASF